VASRLNPYINFVDSAREALQFYEQVFGGNLTLTTFGEFGAPDAPEADKIMHGQLTTDKGFTLMAADTPPGMPLHAGDNVTISLSGDDTEELHGYWSALSEGATITIALEKQMWGDEFGMLIDRFGIPWLVNIGESQA
jgi:PhnB protein